MKILRALIALSLASQTALGQLSSIGAAAAVRGKVLATAPAAGAVGRIVESGKPLYLRDKVTTDAQGRLQIMLLDETVFTIGPNSAMVLDEFVYNPATGTGKVAAKVTSGAFRFITGKVAKNRPEDMKVRLPSGTIGIRGTICAGKIDGSQSLVVLLGPGGANNAGEVSGAVSVSNAGSEVTLHQPGFGTTVTPGSPPSPPFAVPPQVLAELTSSLAPEPKQDSGSENSGSGGGSSTAEKEESSSVGEQSGQVTAAGGETAAVTAALSDLSNTSQDSTVVAVQDSSEKALTDTHATNSSSSSGGSSSFSSGLATWDNVRSLTTGGTVIFNSNDAQTTATAYTCGGLCEGTGFTHLILEINFASRVIGGGTSSFHTMPSGALGFQNTNINSFSYNSLSGNGTFTLNSSASSGTPGSHTNSSFNNSVISINNSSSRIADNVTASLSYNDGSRTATGSNTAPRP